MFEIEPRTAASLDFASWLTECFELWIGGGSSCGQAAALCGNWRGLQQNVGMLWRVIILACATLHPRRCRTRHEVLMLEGGLIVLR